MLSQCLAAFFAHRPALALLSPRRFFCFAGFLITKLALIKFDHASVGDNYVAAVLIAAIQLDPAGHHPFKELSRLFDLAAKQVNQIINGALALLHQSAKLLERALRIGHFSRPLMVATW